MPDRPRFTTTFDAHDATATVVALGELDLATAPMLGEALAEALRVPGVQHICVDLAGVGFADSTALQVLILAARRVRDQGGTFNVVAPSEPVRRLLATTALERYFGVPQD
jgi:anti-sigma B factor antagonist